MASNNLDAIEKHYESCWQGQPERRQLNAGPTWQLPVGFRVLVFAPTGSRKMWTYATCGMSQQSDAVPIELHLFSPIQFEPHVELLTAITHYHLTGEYINLGHTVNFGRPWMPKSECQHGLISLPYLDGPKLEWFENNEERIRFLWLIPITRKELEYKKTQSLEALESRFEERNFNYLDPLRESVV